MKYIKAILAGSLFIIVIGLVLQLVFIFAAVGYNELAKMWPDLNDFRIYFRYLLGMPIYILLMFLGGYITAAISKQHVYLNCLIVALITIAITITSALSYSDLTVSGVVVIVLSLLGTLAGGAYWARHNSPVL